MHFKHRSAFFFDMKCKEIIKYFEEWAPKEIAWHKDNTGLQVGSFEREIKNILLCLELTDKALNEAIKKDCNLIISHHPLLFHPLKNIDVSNDKNSMLVEKLIKNDITLYSAHTNLDYTKDGVSFTLAKTLGLSNINFLVNLNSNQYKLTIFVPEDSLVKVADAVFNSGGGRIGEYSNCSFRSGGTGTFKGSEKSKPSNGQKGNFEQVEEVKLEVIVDKWKLNKIIAEVNKVHPYEELAYDVIPLNNPNINYGVGAIGELGSPLTQNEFLLHVSKLLKAKNLRYSKEKNKSVKKVAVCGGSGIEYLNNALTLGADAYVTADIKYHSFQDAEEKILLIDAGHYETEIHALNEVKTRLENFVKNYSSIKIFKYSGSTNPVNFFNLKGVEAIV